MNAPIVRLFGLVCLLFAVLVVFTTRWTVVEAQSLRDNPLNRRALLQEERIKRGVIRAADRTVLAGSTRLRGGRYGRRYPRGALFAHPVGYSFTSIGRSGLEKSRNDDLTGRETELVSVLDSVLGQDRVGKDVLTTLDAQAQAAAFRALGGRRGAVVALDVDTGAVRVMASEPSYDPNGLGEPGRLSALGRDPGTPLVDRTTQSGYPPGSTMKVVTAAAALDTGRYAPTSIVDGRNAKPISGVPLNNFGGQSFGPVDLTTALTKSINTVWAEVGVRLGRRTMTDYMERFGFYADPPLDYPDEQMIPSGVRAPGLVRPTSRKVDVGRMAIGQGGLLATPMQMAMVAQTVANRGRRLKPYLVEKVVAADGRVDFDHKPEQAARVMSPRSAALLTQMMKNVVREGTGTAAALQGVEVAGKTGTAEIDIARRINDPWFIGFTPRLAVAVVLERVPGGQGGTVAAPVARQVLQALGA